jgi:hypothetical protein
VLRLAGGHLETLLGRQTQLTTCFHERTHALFALVFASLIGLALLVSEQARRERGLDDRDPHVTRGGFGG